MGFEPTTLRDLVGCSNHWATGDSMASKGEMQGWNVGLWLQPRDAEGRGFKSHLVLGFFPSQCLNLKNFYFESFLVISL